MQNAKQAMQNKKWQSSSFCIFHCMFCILHFSVFSRGTLTLALSRRTGRGGNCHHFVAVAVASTFFPHLLPSVQQLGLPSLFRTVMTFSLPAPTIAALGLALRSSLPAPSFTVTLPVAHSL